MNWATSFRSIAALGVVSFLLLTGYLSVLAQDPTLDVVALNKADAVSYRILFRQVENYKRLSDEAAAQGRDMSYLRQILPGRLELNKADAESLERISIACTGELTILQARVVQAIAASRQQASQNKALGTKSAVAPVSLSSLQAESDVIVLRYRDTLRNSMDEAAFQKAQAEIRRMFGKTPNGKNFISVPVEIPPSN